METNNEVYKKMKDIEKQWNKQINSMIEKAETAYDKSGELFKKLNRHLVVYYASDILNLVFLTEDTKKGIMKAVGKIRIYNNQTDRGLCFVVEYRHYSNIIRFELLDPDIVFYKNGKVIKSYNIKGEFSSFNFDYLERDGFLDNYIKVFYQDECMHFGMVLMAYVYLIDYKKYKNKRFNYDMLDSLDKIVLLDHIFRSIIE